MDNEYHHDGDDHHNGGRKDDGRGNDCGRDEGHRDDHAQSNGNAYAHGQSEGHSNGNAYAYGHSKGNEHDHDGEGHNDHNGHHQDRDHHDGDSHHGEHHHDGHRHDDGHDHDDGHHHHDGHHPEGDACDHNPPPCFVKGTLIETPAGAVPVERLRAGDKVICADGSVQSILWAGGRVLGEAELQAHPQLRPVVIRFGSLGNRRELRLSPQHAVVLHTSEGARLARATHLAQREGGSFRVAHGVKSVSYHHLLLPRHALLLAEGAVVESMWPGPMAIAAVGPESRADILRHAPDLKPALDGDMPVETLYGPRAAPVLSGREVRTMRRIETPEMRRLQPAA